MKLYRAPQTRSMRVFDLLPQTRNIGAYAERCLARPANQAAAKAAS